MLTRRDLLHSAVAGGAVLLATPGLVRAAAPAVVSNALELGAVPELTEVTAFGVSDAQISSQQIIADKKGFFAEQGLKVTNKLIPSGPDIGPLIAGGSAPVSFETNITVISVAANDVPAVIVGTLANIAGTQAVVGRKDLVLKSAKDLEGKKVGMVRGAGVLIAFRNMASDLGVDLNKVQFISISPADQLAALDKGDIDALACWEPYITKGVALGGNFLFSGTYSALPDNAGDVQWMDFHTTMQVTKDFLAQNPGTVTAMLAALNKATDFVNNNRDESLDILSGVLSIERDQLSQMMNRNMYSMVVDDRFVTGSQTITDFMFELNNIPKKPMIADYVDFSALKQVDPGLVQVPL
jgi:NitT/TauT family transport system substrate-binding protein